MSVNDWSVKNKLLVYFKVEQNKVAVRQILVTMLVLTSYFCSKTYSRNTSCQPLVLQKCLNKTFHLPPASVWDS